MTQKILEKLYWDPNKIFVNCKSRAPNHKLAIELSRTTRSDSNLAIIVGIICEFESWKTINLNDLTCYIIKANKYISSITGDTKPNRLILSAFMYYWKTSKITYHHYGENIHTIEDINNYRRFHDGKFPKCPLMSAIMSDSYKLCDRRTVYSSVKNKYKFLWNKISLVNLSHSEFLECVPYLRSTGRLWNLICDYKFPCKSANNYDLKLDVLKRALKGKQRKFINAALQKRLHGIDHNLDLVDNSIVRLTGMPQKLFNDLCGRTSGKDEYDPEFDDEYAVENCKLCYKIVVDQIKKGNPKLAWLHSNQKHIWITSDIFKTKNPYIYFLKENEIVNGFMDDFINNLDYYKTFLPIVHSPKVKYPKFYINTVHKKYTDVQILYCKNKNIDFIDGEFELGWNKIQEGIVPDNFIDYFDIKNYHDIGTCCLFKSKNKAEFIIKTVKHLYKDELKARHLIGFHWGTMVKYEDVQRYF